MNRFKKLLTFVLAILQSGIIVFWGSFIFIMYFIIILWDFDSELDYSHKIINALLEVVNPTIFYFSGLVAEIYILVMLVKYLRNNYLRKKDYVIFAIALLIQCSVLWYVFYLAKQINY